MVVVEKIKDGVVSVLDPGNPSGHFAMGGTLTLEEFMKLWTGRGAWKDKKTATGATGD